jgi:nitrogen regulatory protein PII
MITTVTPEDRLPEVLNAIQKGAYTGKIGDGKIFVSHVEEVVRIRTGDTRVGAL